MELMTLSTEEIRRLEALWALAAGTQSQAQAARSLGLSVRQVKRLWRRYRLAGSTALASGHRGRRPNNAIDPVLKAQILAIHADRYPDFGPSFAAEKLREEHGLEISRETLRSWLIEQGRWKARRRKVHPRPPRERRPCFGELIQADGSPHAWFEGRGPRCTLLLAIDDASSRIGAALFVPAETTNGYFELFRQYFERYGLPDAFYVDRHSIFRINTPLVEDRQTQLARALQELDVELICANSPQAKGRVERANRTLQDRLVKELRLRNIGTLQGANDFLPLFISDYNQRFAKAPASVMDAHRGLDAFDLDEILCQTFQRVVTKNLTVQFEDAIYALTDSYSRGCLRAGVRINLKQRRDGSLSMHHRDRRLDFQLVERIIRNAAIVTAKELATRPPKGRDMPQMARLPQPNHPWRNAKPAPKGDISALQAGDIIALR
jgi:transposase